MDSSRAHERRSGTERRSRSRFSLTPRELEVLGLVLRGAGNKQIAADLGVTEQAIKEHVSTLLDKFDVPNRAALAEAGTRLEFTGETGIDRSWMRDLFIGSKAQIVIARGEEIRYEAANVAFMESVGWRPVIGRTMRAAFPELDGTGVFEKVEAVYRTGVPLIEHEQERRWDRGNGMETRLVDLVIQPLHDSEGKVNGIVSYAVDVTDVVADRKRSELLREEYAALLDQVPSGVLVVDEKGQVVKVNEAGMRIGRIVLDPTRSLDEQALEYDLRDASGRHVTGANFPIARALAGEDVPAQDFTFSVEPGIRIKIRTSVRTLRDPDGRIRGVMVVFTELGTERSEELSAAQ